MNGAVGVANSRESGWYDTGAGLGFTFLVVVCCDAAVRFALGGPETTLGSAPNDDEY
jgi:hypothetical protein